MMHCVQPLQDGGAGFVWDKNSLPSYPHQAAPLCVSQNSHFPPQRSMFMEELLRFGFTWHILELAPARFTQLECITDVQVFLIFGGCFIQQGQGRVF